MIIMVHSGAWCSIMLFPASFVCLVPYVREGWVSKRHKFAVLRCGKKVRKYAMETLLFGAFRILLTCRCNGGEEVLSCPIVWFFNILESRIGNLVRKTLTP